MQAHKLSHIWPYTDTFVCRIHLASVNDLNKHKSGTAAAEANLLTSHGNMIDNTTQHKVMTTADKNCQERSPVVSSEIRIFSIHNGHSHL